MISAEDKTTSIVLVGVGGQGIMLASEIVARTAMSAGYEVKTNEVHGMAQRGGAVVAQIRYARVVHSPLVPRGSAAVLGSLERIEALRHAPMLADDGLAVVNSQVLLPVTVSMGMAEYPPDAEEQLRATFPKLLYVEAGELARQAGRLKAANVALLGALSTGLDLPVDAWEQAVADNVPGAMREINLAAFRAGRALRENV
jgi:indolepyruvate ferredoxin oxidoreductase, beta subunit